MNYCSKCGNLNNEEHKFCTKCGTKIVEQVEEEVIVNDSQSNQNKKENIPNYNKIGGFLIFIGIILVLGLLGTVTFFNENYTNEYYESLATLYVSNNELFTLLNISYYLALICLFFLILLNISFFTKSNITKKLAIIYFTLLIITDIYGVFIFSDNEEIMSKLSIEIIKISFQIVSALLFIIYFSISNRVKETFIEERNFGFHFVISIILPIILFFYYSNKLNEIKYKLSTNDSSFSKTNSVSNGEINQPIQGNNTIPKSSTNVEIKQQSSKNIEIESSKNSDKNAFQSIFEYKDWKYESFDDFFKVTTNGKVGASSHEFGIIRRKEQCNNNLLWLTFSTINDISSFRGENIKFKITIDNNTFYQELPILSVNKVTSSLNIVAFSNFVLNDYTLSLLKKGKKIEIEIDKTNRLYDKFDIKSEEFSLEGFVANYMKLDEKCNRSNNKILFEYVKNNDYGAGGVDRTYKLTRNGKSCIYNYSVGLYNGEITDSCTGKYEFQVRDNNGNFIQNNDNHWSPIPYHDAFRLMTGDEMKINHKIISTTNSKNELIYCLEDMSICKTEKELSINKESNISKNILSSSEKNEIFFSSDIEDLVLNLTDSRGKEKLMKLSFSIKSSEPTIAAIVEEFKAEIVDVVISQISSRSSDELLTVSGKNLLKDELLQDINNVINEVTKSRPEVKKNNIKQLLFTTFVIK